ncbi:putative cation exchanger C3A12.06c [Ceratocystis fimbriata CBS 114723]|uniref:Putative cation exchanger C3A12.06c n=1 Tax=Ceratocystis fimbriata CBS 114723 TaxID=1035309 RepID=A0A2C5XCU8_9PEZI|nr:putative cation exchanger C3A12.06c [Ceratocystis fimbriata CBS 114723]
MSTSSPPRLRPLNPRARPAVSFRKPRRPLSLRPFAATIATIFLLASWSYVSHTIVPGLRINRGPDDPPDSLPQYSFATLERSVAKQLDCRDVIYATDKCSFVQEHCSDENAGLISYLSLYYCYAPLGKPVNFVFLVMWLGLLFTTIGIAASDFFSVNLATISSLLGLSQSLAGVTFLAFGNGSPDVFSTFAAMGSGSASMAVGELIGAASFITAVVAGSMALVQEFRVAKKTFVRDICFFIFAVVFTTYFLFDGKLLYWECWVMIAYYGLYVVTVVTWHWYEKRSSISARHIYQDNCEFEPYRDRDAASTSHSIRLYGSSNSSVLLLSPDTRHPSPPENADPTTPLLESGMKRHYEEEEAQENDDLESLVAAEISSNMRVLRPPGRRRNTVMTPIRPSLVGALEFRSDLARVQRELNPVPCHNHSSSSSATRPPSHSRCWSTTDMEGMFNPPTSRSRSPSPHFSTGAVSPLALGDLSRPSLMRERALSSGDQPNGNDLPVLVPPPAMASTDDLSRLLRGASVRHHTPSSDQRPVHQHSRTASSTSSSFRSFKIDGNLAPPPVFQHHHHSKSGHSAGSSSARRSPLSPTTLPKLHIPSPLAQATVPSEVESPLSPFPGLDVTSLPVSPTIPEEVEEGFEGPQMSVVVPTLNIESPRSASLQESSPYSWWPSFLPSPSTLSCTLFPTLQRWEDKGHWDKFISIVTVPSILLLVLTLPVVDGEDIEGEADHADYTLPSSTPIPPLAPPVTTATSVAANGTYTPVNLTTPISITAPFSPSLVNPPSCGENEWQRYRRYSLSRGRKNSSVFRSSRVATPALIAIDSPTNTRSELHITAPVDAAMLSAKISETQQEAAAALSWSRWLVGVQIFTGPAFFVCVVWANLLEDLANPVQSLKHFLLMGLAFSMLMFGVFLLTTAHDVRPKYHSMLCFMGFLVSIAWIATIAGEVVGVLKAVGVIMDISEALLGLTIFAAGNSLGDLVADITVARLGYPVMALAACFGGPMLNILLGIGVGGVMMMYRRAHHKHQHDPSKPIHYKPFKVEVGGALLISAIGLLITLVVLLVVVPANKWVLNRKIGWGLIILWGVTTSINVALELGGYLR